MKESFEAIPVKSDALNTTRSCEVNQAYLDDLETFLANHYQVDEADVTVSYSGINGEGEHVFPFVVETATEDINGDYIVDDLCLAYSADFIVEEDLIGL